MAARPDDSEQNHRYGLFHGLRDERDLISSRTMEALKSLKARGVTLGRPPGPRKSKLDMYRPEIEALLKNGSTQRFIAKRYNTTEANLNKWLHQRGLNPKKMALATTSIN